MIHFPTKGPRSGPPGAPHEAPFPAGHAGQAGPPSPPAPAPTLGKNRGNGVARPRTVLVLGGGGMRGMAHLGVLQAMATLGLQYDAIVGTSIGALVGAMAAGGFSLEKMAAILKDVQKQDYFRLNVVKFLLKGARAPSMYRGDLFKSRLKSILPEIGFEDMRVPFYCNSVRLETGGSVFWGSQGCDDIALVDAIYSSCALPGIFEPLERDGYSYMDGGIVESLPLRFAKTLRPELIIAVDLSVKATFKTP